MCQSARSETRKVKSTQRAHNHPPRPPQTPQLQSWKSLDHADMAHTKIHHQEHHVPELHTCPLLGHRRRPADQPGSPSSPPAVVLSTSPPDTPSTTQLQLRCETLDKACRKLRKQLAAASQQASRAKEREIRDAQQLDVCMKNTCMGSSSWEHVVGY